MHALRFLALKKKLKEKKKKKKKLLHKFKTLSNNKYRPLDLQTTYYTILVIHC